MIGEYRFFRKKQGFIGKCLRVREIKRKRCSLIPVIAWLWHDIALYWAILRHCRAENNTSGGKFRQDYHRDLE